MFWALLELDFKFDVLKVLLMSALTVLACIEKLASTLNTLAVERDWVNRIPQKILNAGLADN
jgi:hypothetical protein